MLNPSLALGHTSFCDCCCRTEFRVRSNSLVVFVQVGGLAASATFVSGIQHKEVRRLSGDLRDLGKESSLPVLWWLRDVKKNELQIPFLLILVVSQLHLEWFWNKTRGQGWFVVNNRCSPTDEISFLPPGVLTLLHTQKHRIDTRVSSAYLRIQAVLTSEFKPSSITSVLVFGDSMTFQISNPSLWMSQLVGSCA